MFICVCVPVCLLEETLVVRFGYFFFLLLIYIYLGLGDHLHVQVTLFSIVRVLVIVCRDDFETFGEYEVVNFACVHICL